MEYYRSAVDLIGKEKLFFIFSDDINWCKNNFDFIENKFFIENNKDYEDLILMSLCSHNIIANSSFSWWGAWLNSNPNKIIISPKKWFGNKYNFHNTKDLYNEKWIKL